MRASFSIGRRTQCTAALRVGMILGFLCLSTVVTRPPSTYAEDAIDQKAVDDALAKLKAREAAATKPAPLPPELRAASVRLIDAKSAVKRREAALEAATRDYTELTDRAEQIRVIQGRIATAPERVKVSNEARGVNDRLRMAKAGLPDVAAALKRATAELDSANRDYEQVLAKWPGVVKEAVPVGIPAAAPTTIATPQQMLATMPRELQLPTAKWDKFDLPKVNEWLDNNMSGSRIEFPVTIERFSVSGPPWRVTVTYARPIPPLRIRAAGRDIVYRVFPASSAYSFGSYEFECDEAAARVFDKKKGGYTVTLGGTIQAARMEVKQGAELSVSVSGITGIDQLKK